MTEDSAVVPIQTLARGTHIQMTWWKCACVAEVLGKGERGVYWIQMVSDTDDCYIHNIEFPQGTHKWAPPEEPVRVLPEDK